MSAPQKVLDLVERFAQNTEAYRSGAYNETQVRREFIDPLFTALGWDVDNKVGYAEAYKDVVHEASVRVKGGSEDGRLKAPDYSFRVGGTRRFFVEAKKPSVDIKGAPAPAFQVRRYGWSDPDVPLSVLTDFEEFAVYDCRIKPEKGDRSSKARVNYYRYEDYAEKWNEIASVFSKDAVLKGSFDKYAASSKRGTAEPGDEFLKQIESWREALAQDVARRNPDLTERQLNAAVQRTIDRIIFLRIAEERGIEGLGELKAAAKGKGVYPRLVTRFREADAKYNSGLFHFGKEKGRAGTADLLTLGLDVGDKVLKEVVGGLYYPESPYALDVLPTDILGQVYERFLGKVIRLDSKHRAVVEEKPEVKKSGGVFYTPTYIVGRIVEGTVGPLLDGLTPNKAEKIRVVDPACGSGSFLLGVYDYLLGWYLSRYVEAPEKWSKGKATRIFENQSGAWQLTIGEKKRVLLTHLFGVDIDPQAVEVTKLSLLLRVLEGETAQTTGQQALFKERVLPELSSNVKCGNSLIGSDFYDGKAFDLFDEDAHYRINAFDWGGKDGFPEIMRKGGFDAVVGNPPYVRIQTMRRWAAPEVDYFNGHYKSAGEGNYDLYQPFIEKGLGLLRDSGRMGYIVQHRFFTSKYGRPLRSLIAEGENLDRVVDFGHQQVFQGASTYTCLLFLTKARQDEVDYTEVEDLDGWRLRGEAGSSGPVPSEKVTATPWLFIPGDEGKLFDRLTEIDTKLEDVTDRIFQGLKTSADKIYIVNEKARDGGRVQIHSPFKEADYWVEPDLFHPLIKGGDSEAFHMGRTDRLILFPYGSTGGEQNRLLTAAEIESKYPLTWAYLKDCRDYLENRESGKMKVEGWYGYVYPKALDVMSLPKLFTPDISPQAAYSLDETGEAFFTGGTAGGYGILVKEDVSRSYILGLLNSRVLDWYNRKQSTAMRGGWYSFESKYIKHLPIVLPEPQKQREKHDRVADLADSIIQLKREREVATSDHAQSLTSRRIEGATRELDGLVYGLYGFSAEEREILADDGHA